MPAWAKTTKFALSFLLYAPTMLWMFSYMTGRPRVKRFVLDACGAILFFEMLMVILQAVRGQPMHFNISTTFNTVLWGMMGVTIFIFYGISILGFVVFLRQKIVADRPFLLSLRLGMALMLIGFGLGYLMTSPTAAQLADMTTGNPVLAAGAHTVGAPDGGPGIALLGWSTTHGDLRIAHFVGIHGAQVLALVGWLQAMGLRGDHVRWVPSNGAAPAMQELAAGGVDVVTCSVPEARSMIDAGRAKSLAIMAAERNPQFKDVPTLNEALGINYSVGAWRGIAGPKGLPPEVQARLVASLKKAYESKEFTDFMGNRGFGVKWADPEGFAAFMNEGDQKMGAAMKAAGLSKTG